MLVKVVTSTTFWLLVSLLERMHSHGILLSWFCFLKRVLQYYKTCEYMYPLFYNVPNKDLWTPTPPNREQQHIRANCSKKQWGCSMLIVFPLKHHKSEIIIKPRPHSEDRREGRRSDIFKLWASLRSCCVNYAWILYKLRSYGHSYLTKSCSMYVYMHTLVFAPTFNHYSYILLHAHQLWGVRVSSISCYWQQIPSRDKKMPVT